MTKKLNFLKIAKIAIGACAAVLLANVLGLRTSTSAGVIALLGIQNTKKETLTVAARRILAFFLALLVAFASFGLLGFRVAAFGVFLFIFTALCYICGLEAGISTNTVLITHLWAAHSMHPALLLNEFFLLLIGTGIAVLINLYMPRNIESIKADQRSIDETIRGIILEMSAVLSGQQQNTIDRELHALQATLDRALTKAYHNMNNTLATDMRYYVQYIEMRTAQCVLLHKIHENLQRLDFVFPQSHTIAAFMAHIASSFHECNNARALLAEFGELRRAFKTGPLPVTRAEFETRALLFQIVIDLEYLILSKKKFAESLTDWQISYFWEKPAS